jgi:hypothetical protein
VEEAGRFLESALPDQDPLYPGYVLTLVLGLRKGGVLGLHWTEVDFGAGEIDVSCRRTSQDPQQEAVQVRIAGS